MRKTKRVTKKQRAELLFTAVLVFAALLWYLFGNGHTSIAEGAQAELHFIDVGQGDGAMLLTDEVCVVVDCGPRARGDEFTEYIKEYTDKIDCLVLSHAHEDHMGAAAEVIQSLEVSQIVMTAYGSDSAFFGRALDAIEEHDVTVTEAVAGESLAVGDVTLEFYSPSKDYGDANSNSIIMRATVDGASVMFTGDAEKHVEEDVLESYGMKLTSHILKVSHHGSSTATSPEFLQAVDPEIAVISCGSGNSYGHPHSETMTVLEEYDISIYRTDTDGNVVLVIRDGGIFPATSGGE